MCLRRQERSAAGSVESVSVPPMRGYSPRTFFTGVATYTGESIPMTSYSVGSMLDPMNKIALTRWTYRLVSTLWPPSGRATTPRPCETFGGLEMPECRFGVLLRLRSGEATIRSTRHHCGAGATGRTRDTRANCFWTWLDGTPRTFASGWRCTEG